MTRNEKLAILPPVAFVIACVILMAIAHLYLSIEEAEPAPKDRYEWRRVANGTFMMDLEDGSALFYDHGGICFVPSAALHK